MQRARNLFAQNKIAIIWDFDKTLIPYDMQRPLFEHYGVDEQTFWREANELPAYYRARGNELVSEQLYLVHMLSYVKAGRFTGLNNTLLRQLGEHLTFYAGLPELFPTLSAHVAQNREYQVFDIAIEHYVVSSGLRQMILGSAIAPYLDGVWACELLEGDAPGPGYLDARGQDDDSRPVEVSQILYAIDDTTKTRAVFEINKGSNWHPQIGVNASIARDDRRVPFENMIYVADGPSDVPVFSIVNQNGGRTLGVYTPRSASAFQKVDALQRYDRVQAVAPADYTPGSHAYLWLFSAVDEIARQIMATRRANIDRWVGHSPSHRASSPSSDPVSPASELRSTHVNGSSGDLIAPLDPLAPEVSAITLKPEDAPVESPASGQPASTTTANGVQMPIAELVPGDSPLLPLPAPIPGPAHRPAVDSNDDDAQDALLAIVSEIAADTRQPISIDELRALRQYLAGRISARSTGARRTRGPRDVRQVTRAEIESQLAAIRGRGL